MNELEYAEDYFYVYVWPSPCIVKIDPDSGIVMGWLNLSKLYPDAYQLNNTAVLNGIAYHKQKKHFLLPANSGPIYTK